MSRLSFSTRRGFARSGSFAVSSSSASANDAAAALLEGKTTLTFDLYLPSSSNYLLNGGGLFTVRPKNASASGYIWYNAEGSGKENAIVKYDEWQTVSVDRSKYGGELTFLGLYTSNIIYIKNIELS